MAEVARLAEEAALKAASAKWAERKAAMAEDAWEAGQMLLKKAREMLAWPLEQTVSADGKTITKPARWSFIDAARMMALADGLQRLALGLPTGRQEVAGPEAAPIKIEMQEEVARRLENALAAMRARINPQIVGPVPNGTNNGGESPPCEPESDANPRPY